MLIKGPITKGVIPVNKSIIPPIIIRIAIITIPVGRC